MTKKFIVIFSFILISLTTARELPKYLGRCSISKNYEKCFVDIANSAIPYIIKGDKAYNLPKFNPLKLTEVHFDPSETLKMTFRNLSVYGFEDAKVSNPSLDLAKKQIKFDIHIPHLHIDGDYEIHGKILLLPIEGTGPARIQLINGIYQADAELNTMSFDSKESIQVKDAHVKYTLERTIYQFDNLFNGNKQLGDHINNVLNDNHEELYRDFSPVFSETIVTIIKVILGGVLKDIYITDLFLP